MSNSLVVSEVFGLTFQGEGRNLGMPCFFLRLAGCNLACSFCDTPYTWDWKQYDIKEETTKMSPSETVGELTRLVEKSSVAPKNLVISGGEPMLQQGALSDLLALLLPDWWVEVETAGTIAPIDEFRPHQFNVSLKLYNSENPLGKRRRPASIEAFASDERTFFKFVVSDVVDFKEIDELDRLYKISRRPIYIMPEGKDAETVKLHGIAVAEETLRRGWHLTTRLQVLLYGNRRGI